MGHAGFSSLLLFALSPAVGRAVEYGVDVSFPMHYDNVTINYAELPHNLDPSIPTPPEYQNMPVQPLGNRQEFYNNMIQGCLDYYGDKADRCLVNERDRVDMSLRQPQSMQNYTEMGFTKIRAPDHVWELIKSFWEKNRGKEIPENWPVGNTYTNHWSSPTYLLSIEDPNLEGAGSNLKKNIWKAAKSTIEEWTKQELRGSSLYGIRIYTEGSVLNTHVDRLPLVSSAIINVDSDLDEPWPLEVIGHDGKAHNVTMEPGDMVLYESHSILHGRPFPLKGRFAANIFVHFEPTGRTILNETESRDLNEAASKNNDLPPYIIPGTPEEAVWRRENANGHGGSKKTFGTGSLEAHHAAQHGDVGLLTRLVGEQKHLATAEDANGWTPMHEGARGGHVSVVQFLYENGADVNHRTNKGRGGTPLYYALQRHGDDHPVSKYLASVGGTNVEPEL